MFYAVGHYVFSYTESGISGLNVNLIEVYETVANQLIYESVDKNESYELLEIKTRGIYNNAKKTYALKDFSCFNAKIKEAKNVLNK